MLGSWEIDVTVGSMPEKVATAFGQMSETLLGAAYEPIAYLGSQVVNGTNYAVLAEQTLTDGKDTKNVVLVIFNEKPGSMNLILANIERVVCGNADCGGVDVNVETEISKGVQLVFDKAMEGFVGSSVVPFALLGTQIVHGKNFLFAAEVDMLTDKKEAAKTVAVVTVNEMDNSISFQKIL